MTGPKNKQSVGEIIRILEERAPSGTAEDWDNVGLLAGDPKWKTAGAVLSIDLTAEAIQAACDRKFKLILNHHPCIFPKSRGLSRLTPGAGASGLVFEALRQGVAVAAYHTNFDKCALEVVEAVSKGLGVVPKGRLVDRASALLKLVVFVPSKHAEAVRAALAKAGAGHIGDYDSCTFGVEGVGTFRGGKNTRPFVGTPGRLETVREVRLETVFPKGLRSEVIAALLSAHPYEEVAYDLYAVDQQSSVAVGLIRGMGYGFWGEFQSPKPFSELTKDVKRVFNVQKYLLTEPAPKGPIKRIGFVAGKGASFLDAACAAGCDLFITGEAGYHVALDGARKGMAVMELGHRESEKFFLSTTEGWLAKMGLKAVKLDLPTQRIQ